MIEDAGLDEWWRDVAAGRAPRSHGAFGTNLHCLHAYNGERNDFEQFGLCKKEGYEWPSKVVAVAKGGCTSEVNRRLSE